jgi:hypothetical protein
VLQERGYAWKDANQLFEPTNLGEALIGAYDGMGLKTVYECSPDSHVHMLACTVCLAHV